MFARRSTHRLFVALACGMILADRSTVVGMAAVVGMALSAHNESQRERQYGAPRALEYSP